MNKIGTLDIIKAYLGNKELSANNAYVGEIPLIKGSIPEPLDKDYFYLQPLSTGNYSISASDEVWKQNNTFEFRLDKTNWRKFSSLPKQETYVGFVEYMANNPDLVALALDINAYNTYIVGQNYRVGLDKFNTTVATFLGTDENFAYYVGTLKSEGPMRFKWGLMKATSTSFDYESNYSTGRMFKWNGSRFSGTNTNISDYSSFNIVTTIITETIPLTANDKLYLRNTSGSIHSGIINSIQSVNYNIGGILNTLTDYTDDTYTITENYANMLFNGNTHLISAGDLKLPATSLAKGCYSYMFFGCTALTEAPALPASTLATSCYYSMFRLCTSLTKAPALPATSLASGCYTSIFQGCTALTKAPTLPATTLASDCYSSMFYGCTALTEAPALPATSLAKGCYASIFQGCKALTKAPTLPATSLASFCYSSMFWNCTSLTEAPALPATTFANDCYYSMFRLCTALTNAPALPVTSLAAGCYSYMFFGCKALTEAPALPASTLADRCYYYMFSGCTSLTEAPALPATSLANYCYYEMFKGCTGLSEAPALPATSLADGCYYYMFQGCTLLNKIVSYAKNISANNCLNNWLNGVSATGDFYNLGGANYPTGTSGIPSGWTVHTSL